jgi:hypothetical protein
MRFTIGQRVRYTGLNEINTPEWVGWTGVVEEYITDRRVQVRWDDPESNWPEDQTAWPLVSNLAPIFSVDDGVRTKDGNRIGVVTSVIGGTVAIIDARGSRWLYGESALVSLEN